MKNILIVSDSLRVGGIQKSLINMLNNFDYSKYNISLLLFDDTDTSCINKNVKILNSNYILRIIGSTSTKLKNTSSVKYILRKIFSLFCKIFGSNIIFKLLFIKSKIHEQYDIAISYSNNVDTNSLYYGYNKFVIEKVTAKTKMCWIHVDFITKKRNNIEEKEFEKMDKIILVSYACKRNFEKIYPQFSNKTFVVYNILNKEELLNLSSSTTLDVKIHDKFTIISVGRIEKNKNISAQVDIAYNLKQVGLDFEWRVLGTGVDFSKIIDKIKELELEKTFFLMGEKSNVYPYIRNSDLLISTSLTESFGLTIAEALLLQVPVLALYYPSLSEIVNDNVICMDCNEMFNKIKKMIENKKEYEHFKKNCEYKITNEIIKKQINNIFGGKND